MKLIIQIPCFNEEATLAITLNALPRHVPGIDVIEVLVVDDGSVDRTVEVAKANGVHHIVRQIRNRGLARAFVAGLDAAINAGADIIVNTDADNQYRADDIEKLCQPILEGKAEIVVGARPITEIAHFSPFKKALQRLGSWAVRVASNTHIADAPSGFRAMSRDAAAQTKVYSDYTYTLETIIQAGQRGMVITSVPIRVNGDLRPSRLMKSMASYLKRSVLTIVRIFIIYKPLRFFASLGATFFLIGAVIWMRFLFYYLQDEGGGHIQSLILGAVLIGISFLLLVLGLLADLIAVNRTVLEKVEWRIYKLQQDLKRKQ
jgi:glycosyltransferase involved in cell wall biosynthesis